MKIKLKKLEEVVDPTHPNNKEVGYERIGSVRFESFVEPTVGERFWNGDVFTSEVREVLSENTFKTLNSVYEWEVIDE